MVLSHTQKNIFRLATMQIFDMSTLAKLQRADLSHAWGYVFAAGGTHKEKAFVFF